MSMPIITVKTKKKTNKRSLRDDSVFKGNFDAKDLVVYFDKLGIRIDLSEAKKLIQKFVFLRKTFENEENDVFFFGKNHLEWIQTIRCRFLMMNGVRSSSLILSSSIVSSTIHTQCSNIGVAHRFVIFRRFDR